MLVLELARSVDVLVLSGVDALVVGDDDITILVLVEKLVEVGDVEITVVTVEDKLFVQFTPLLVGEVNPLWQVQV